MSIRNANKVLNEAIHQLVEGKVMDSERFCKALERKAKIGNKHLNCDYYNRFNQAHDNVIITFVNLPKNKPMGGAEEMNNRYQITVDGFSPELGSPPPSGKVKAKTMTGALGFSEAGLKMRGKTATPEKMVDYIAAFLGKLAKVKAKVR